MDYDSLLELVKTRRSIRRFKPNPIPDEYIDKIIEAARWARILFWGPPQGADGNKQWCRILKYTSPAA